MEEQGIWGRQDWGRGEVEKWEGLGGMVGVGCSQSVMYERIINKIDLLNFKGPTVFKIQMLKRNQSF